MPENKCPKRKLLLYNTHIWSKHKYNIIIWNFCHNIAWEPCADCRLQSWHRWKTAAVREPKEGRRRSARVSLLTRRMKVTVTLSLQHFLAIRTLYRRNANDTPRYSHYIFVLPKKRNTSQCRMDIGRYTYCVDKLLSPKVGYHIIIVLYFLYTRAESTRLYTFRSVIILCI